MATSEATGPSEENEEDSQDKYVPHIPDLKQRRQEKITDEIRMVIIGKTGCGKSSTGNTILNKKVFPTGVFQNSVTAACKMETTHRKNKNILLVDTPGFFDTRLSVEAVKLEILKCFAMLYPGPHVILFALNIRRYTLKEVQATEKYLELFGGNPFKYTVIVLTGKDELERTGISVENYMKEMPNYLRNFIKKCDDRVVCINNVTDDSDQQVDDLFRIISVMIRRNAEHQFYINDVSTEITNIRKAILENLCSINENNQNTQKKFFKAILAVLSFGCSYFGIFYLTNRISAALPGACFIGLYIWEKLNPKSRDQSELAKAMQSLEQKHRVQCCIS